MARESVEEPPLLVGNPIIIAVATHSTSTLLLGMMLTEVVPVPAQGVMPALFLFAGGIVQFVASILILFYRGPLVMGATFSAMFFGSFAAFWMSLAFILLGLQNGWLLQDAATQAADSGTGSPLGESLGAFLTVWGALSFIWWIASFRLPLVHFTLFTLTVPAFLLGAAGFWSVSDIDNLNNTALQAAGWCIIAIGIGDYYLFLGDCLMALGAKPPPIGPRINNLFARSPRVGEAPAGRLVAD